MYPTCKTTKWYSGVFWSTSKLSYNVKQQKIRSAWQSMQNFISNIIPNKKLCQNSIRSIRHVIRQYSRISSLWIRSRFWMCQKTWIFESTPMMETVETTCKGFDILSPDYSLSHTIHIIGLVDDKRQYTNDWKEQWETTICDNLQRAASSWEKIFHTSDGALELTKYAWYLITWEFTDSGLPYINKKTTIKTIPIPSSNDTIIRTIQQLKTTE